MVFQAGANIIGGYLASSGSGKRSRTEKKNQSTIDQILAGLKGEGPYAKLYAGDEEAFQKSFVDPAKAMFKNQIAPQIQQGFIANGMQNGTGLEDTLTRAGVDLDQLINQEYMNFQNNAMNRSQSAIDQILNANVGGHQYSSSERWNQAIGGYLTSPEFNKQVSGGGQAWQQGQDMMAKYYTGGAGGAGSAGRPGFSGGG